MRLTITLTMLLMLLALPLLVQAQQLFDYNGQALVPLAEGDTLSMYAQIFDPFPAETPLPLDFDNYEYTIFITNLVLGAEQIYSNGSIAIYKDDTTASGFPDVLTFTDGSAILTGVVKSFSRLMFTGTLGSAAGFVDWTGGSLVHHLLPEDRVDWYLVAGINAMTAFTEPGFDENWDGKVEPPHTVANEAKTWNQVKNLFR